MSTLEQLSTVRLDQYTDGSRCYVAEAPDFPGCVGYGDTPEEALESLEAAKEACAIVAVEQGETDRGIPGRGMHAIPVLGGWSAETGLLTCQ